MTSNRLKLNDDKTHLLVMTTDQMRRNYPVTVHITTPSETIEPSETETLLGAKIQQNLKFTEHIRDDEKSLFSQLTTRLNGLKKISKVASFKTRLMIANGIFMSKLIYVIPLWCGCESYLIKSLQIIQNKAARVVTKSNWYTPVKTLLSQCNWMSVNQLGVYHSLVLQYKILQSKCPRYLHDKVSSTCPANTRLANSKCIRMGPDFRSNLELTENSYRWRTAKQWNALPDNLRKIGKLKQFKLRLRIWVKENVSI